MLHFDEERFVAVKELYQSLQTKFGSPEEVAVDEGEVDLDPIEHTCTLAIHISSELPPPIVIIDDSAGIIADNESQRVQYERMANPRISMLS